jgi:uncharacterized protein
MKYKLISKTIFFPKEGILAVGDLHLGYDSMLKNQGINLSIDQLEETKSELEIILKKVKAIYNLKKIILLGDIKHHFGFEKSEIFDVRSFLKFLEKFVPKKDIILIKGNHDTFTLKDYELKNYYLSEDENLAFTHGDKTYEELFKNKKIKIIVTSHIHPAVLLKDKHAIKKEKYKCFLIGKYKSKEIIIVPSFFPLIEGSEVNEIESSSGRWTQLIPKDKMKSFEAYIVSPGKAGKVYPFGKFGEIN